MSNDLERIPKTTLIAFKQVQDLYNTLPDLQKALINRNEPLPLTQTLPLLKTLTEATNSCLFLTANLALQFSENGPEGLNSRIGSPLIPNSQDDGSQTEFDGDETGATQSFEESQVPQDNEADTAVKALEALRQSCFHAVAAFQEACPNVAIMQDLPEDKVVCTVLTPEGTQLSTNINLDHLPCDGGLDAKPWPGTVPSARNIQGFLKGMLRLSNDYVSTIQLLEERFTNPDMPVLFPIFYEATRWLSTLSLTAVRLLICLGYSARDAPINRTPLFKFLDYMKAAGRRLIQGENCIQDVTNELIDYQAELEQDEMLDEADCEDLFHTAEMLDGAPVRPVKRQREE
ncbi:hypothetical protein BDN72DRAFT_923695 [Pluteus cervinus]|uniref:Uncharacterized protein n=1 Tax=Pluteus cervinus TaxID=181527 RepID=A0ACD3BHS4_9AGAR|nr:hypothetical protein BDN72DRAFT_923695 [Pluteus cervinus]